MPRATNILIIGFRLLTDVQIRAALLRNTLRPDSGEQGDAPLRTKKAVLSTPCNTTSTTPRPENYNCSVAGESEQMPAVVYDLVHHFTGEHRGCTLFRTDEVEHQHCEDSDECSPRGDFTDRDTNRFRESGNRRGYRALGHNEPPQGCTRPALGGCDGGRSDFHGWLQWRDRADFHRLPTDIANRAKRYGPEI